jgi:hypothetical protein
MASLSALLILAMCALSMEPSRLGSSTSTRQRPSSYTTAQVSSLEAQRAGGDRRRGTSTRVPETRSEVNHCPRMQRPRRLGDQGGAGRRRTGAGGPGGDPDQRRLSGVLAEHSLIG